MIVVAVQANLAILAALASRPDGRIAFAELERQLQAHDENGEIQDRIEQQVTAGIELIEAGLAIVDGDSLEITEAGRSVIEALPDRSSPQSNSLEIIDHLIGAEVRSRMLNLDLREETEPLSSQGSHIPTTDGAPMQVEQPSSAALDESAAVPEPAMRPAAAPAPSAPAPRLTSREPNPAPDHSDWRTRIFDAVSRPLHRLAVLWRRHLEEDLPKARTVGQSARVNGIVITLVSLLVVIICAGAVIALRQIRSLQTEISSLQRELSPLKERLSRFDQAEKARQAEDKARGERNKRTADNPPQQALALSREEIQVIRDYIKPAPGTGTSTAAPAVGDPIAGATIPFPSPITEKVPKLLGARFAIRNGAILIVRRDSRQIDAVLGPN
ncbi:hypothetical protein [Bradyrhizobium stylosanthis]|uniref:Uncharacterized protein n=1 Tax=Bradyrhizobium stylosanthis TaxID=1803665 RepID=A0A560DPT8_9BRAD|nr:hypothetical protein [Bradyrhizobium stylosanthis]TWA99126.1 hypothetical protein FBZ96_10494 [Bradyrhizobium stylosanthis]